MILISKIILIVCLFDLNNGSALNKTQCYIESLYKSLQREYFLKPHTFPSSILRKNVCQVTCKTGMSLVRRADSMPRYNGCSSYGIKINFDEFNANELTMCCNSLDLCYGNCYDTKNNCDMVLNDCLFKACTKMSFNQNWGTIENYACSGVIKLMYESVKDLGCLAYVHCIKQNCECIDDN